MPNLPYCCDLLSTSGFTFFDNNIRQIDLKQFLVVICFQPLGLRSLITTQAVDLLAILKL